MFMRETSRFVAGSRFKYTPDSIELTDENLVKAIGDAIDAQESAVSGSTTTESYNMHKEEVQYDFTALMKEVQATVGSIMSSRPEMEHKIVAIVDKHLGKGRKVSDSTAEQAEFIHLIVSDIKADLM